MKVYLTLVCFSFSFIFIPLNSWAGTPGCPVATKIIPARYEAIIEKDITFCKGGNEDLKLDIARPKSEETFPGIVYVHGGAWSGGTKDDFGGDMWQAAERGFVAVTINHRVTHTGAEGKIENQFPVHLQDVKCAVRWFRNNAEKYHVDPKRIGMVGSSSGGHLALMTALTPSSLFSGDAPQFTEQSSEIQAVVNYFGPTDLIALYEENSKVAPILKSVFRGTPADKTNQFKEYSPITYLAKNSPKIFSIHGTLDDLVLFSQAEYLDRQAMQVGASHQLLRCEGLGHGLEKYGEDQVTLENRKRALEWAFSFLDENLRNSESLNKSGKLREIKNSRNLAKTDKGCPYQENCSCESPGSENQWIYLYCLSEIGTDDCDASGMNACLKRLWQEKKTIQATRSCERNNYWHKKVCTLLYKPKKKKFESCMKEIPPFIKNGCG